MFPYCSLFNLTNDFAQILPPRRVYGANPLIVSWISANTAGSTKKSVVLAGYNAAVSCGNIIGPLLFTDENAPLYRHGLLACVGIFAALAGSIVLQVINLVILHRLKQRQCVRAGKASVIHDTSMDIRYRQADVRGGNFPAGNGRGCCGGRTGRQGVVGFDRLGE
ncbi:hypothetical protein C8R43DRAFT_908175 [Mycena crocata]|nr:hypothetical protein C8R43DRAFT_908175 [Mycena crocata]